MIEGMHFVSKRLAGGRTRWYVYAWRGGPQVQTTDGPARPRLTAAAVREVAKALKSREAERPGGDLLVDLARAWRSSDPARPSSPEWEKLGTNTKKTWGSALNRIEERWGPVPLALFDDSRMIAKVIAWRNSRIDTPRAADIGVTVLRALLKFGMQRGRLSRNVADGIGRLYVDGQRAEIIWTDEDLAIFERTAGTEDARTVDAVLLCSVTGLRREDLARLTWANVGEFAILKKAAKASRGRRRFATMPRIPELDEVLERLRRVRRAAGTVTVLVSPSGQPWNLDTLSKAVSRVAREAGIHHIDEDGTRRGKHLHDVRGTFVTRLAVTTDLTDVEIAGIMGWSPQEVARIRSIYVEDAARYTALGRRIARGRTAGGA